jgi:hypothetical protein
MNNAILPGDHVILAPVNGLGCGAFLVLEVDPNVHPTHRLYVEGRNGQRWWARIEGARILPEEPEGNFTSSRHGDW